MQEAVSAVSRSPHETNKIAACFFGKDLQGKPFSKARSNDYPKDLESFVSKKKRFGKNSGYIHAELCAILASTEGWKEASIAVTDPPCPNCMKHIATAQVKSVYIDHKGFEKDFFRRRLSDFNILSKKIAQLYGITLFKVYRKEKRIEPLFEPLGPPVGPVGCTRIASEMSPGKALSDEKSGSAFVHGKTKKEENPFCLISAPFYYSATGKEEPLPLGMLSGRFHLESFPLFNAVIEAKRLGLRLEGKSFSLKGQITPHNLILALKLSLEGTLEELGKEPTILDKKFMLEFLAQTSR